MSSTEAEPSVPLQSKADMPIRQQRRPANRADYHPFLFTLMTLTAAAELGLIAFLISAGNEARSWTNASYHSLLILLCFSAAWTLLFSTAYVLWVVDGAVHLLAQVASSIAWLLLTAVLWGVGAGLMHSTRSGGDCAGQPPISRCRQTLTVEALGWTEFSLCCVTLAATLLWLRTGLGKRRWSIRDSRTFV